MPQPTQPTIIRVLLIVLAVGGPSAHALAAVAEQYDCRRDDILRRIEVQVSDRPSQLPCEVVYAKGGSSSVLWEADNELDFCMERARELAGRLEESGWACTMQGAGTKHEAPRRDDPAPEEAAPNEAAPADTAPEALPSGFAREVEPSAGRPERAVLDDALERDLDRLSKLTPSGEFRVEAVSLGDIDRNGLEDAAVLMTYGRDGSNRDRYLVAYLFDGETFKATAQAPIGQNVSDLESAELRGVERGGIDVLLSFREPHDPECCPSGRRKLNFVLREGALVEQSAPGKGA
jgi:hypothetical protein